LVDEKRDNQAVNLVGPTDVLLTYQNF